MQNAGKRDQVLFQPDSRRALARDFCRRLDRYAVPAYGPGSDCSKENGWVPRNTVFQLFSRDSLIFLGSKMDSN